MKQILTIIVTLVCVFAAYSQNTVYIWKGNILSVQAADSLTIDMSTDNLVDLGLSVMWAKSDASSGCAYSDAYSAVRRQNTTYRLPTAVEYGELARRCIITNRTYNWLTFISPNGNSISLRCTSSDHTYGESYWYHYWVSTKYKNTSIGFRAVFFEDIASYDFGSRSQANYLPVRAVCSY